MTPEERQELVGNLLHCQEFHYRVRLTLHGGATVGGKNSTVVFLNGNSKVVQLATCEPADQDKVVDDKLITRSSIPLSHINFFESWAQK